MNSELLSTLGLCKRAGMLAVGEEPVEAIARARDARVIFLAADAAENTVRRAAHFAEAGQCLWLRLPFSKEQLGRAVGRTSCAVIAVTDIGFAASIVGRLAQSDPDTYKESAERLELKARRAAERKEELTAHEKNLRQGKRRPAAPEEPVPPKSAPRTGNGNVRRNSGNAAQQVPQKRTGRPVRKESDRKESDRTVRKTSDRPFHKKTDQPFGKTPGRSSAKGPRPSFGKSPPGAAPRPPHSDRTPAGPRQGGHPHGTRKSANPYLHSRPVKRGKGSFRKKES